MDLGFEFSIGDIVRLKVSANQTGHVVWAPEGSHNEMRGQIIARICHECSGGVQREYDVRWVRASGDVVRELFMHNEIELVASEPFPKTEGKT